MASSISLPFSAPQPLAATHRLDEFACREPSLDEWLKRRALANQASGASRCFVVLDSDHRVMGYYALAAGAVNHQTATSNVRRSMPDPVPVMVLGRLAIDQRAQGLKLGSAMLKDAVQRAQMVSAHAGVRALLVHALSESAREFYLHYGFQESPVQRMTLMMKISKPAD